jgi:hypothetical protein
LCRHGLKLISFISDFFRLQTFAILPEMFSSEIKSVHFTGIGGTAMASAAAAMLDMGFAVTGSSRIRGQWNTGCCDETRRICHSP